MTTVTSKYPSGTAAPGLTRDSRRYAALRDSPIADRSGPSDAALAVDRVAARAVAFAEVNLRAVRRIPRHGFQRHLAERANIGRGLPHLAVGHRPCAGHFRAANAILDDFDQRGSSGARVNLAFASSRAAAALAFRPMAERAMDLKQFLSALQVGAAVRKLDRSFRSSQRRRARPEQCQCQFHIGTILSLIEEGISSKRRVCLVDRASG